MKFKITYKDKQTWDYMTFSSGYRNNYWKERGKVDMGGSGTYQVICNSLGTSCWDSNVSRSRTESYKFYYGILTGANIGNLSNVCSGYSAKLWNAYRPGNLSLLSHNVTPQDICNVIK